MKSVIVTGCFGFIGSHFTRLCLESGFYVYGIDSLTYAADQRQLHKFFIDEFSGQFEFIQEDISKLKYLPDADFLVNFAAESHVDNSIINSEKFINSNIKGVVRLLDLIKQKQQYKVPLFIQISTDEVYGDNKTNISYTEEQIPNPSNPYAASKLSADYFILSYHKTHNISYLIFRPTNNYGVGQHSEKLVPKSIQLLMRGEKIQLHGNGSFERCWLHVEDTCDAILKTLKESESNEFIKNNIYNISGDEYIKIKDIAHDIVNNFGEYTENDNIGHIEFDYYRKGADVNYRINDDLLRRIIHWSPQRKFKDEIKKIIKYTKEHFRW